VTFPFEIKATRDMNGLAEARGKQIVYLKTLQENAPATGSGTRAAGGAASATALGGARGGGPGKGGRQAASTLIEGFSADPKDFDIRVENHKTGAGVRMIGDHPLWRINFWSVRTTVCPEAYVEVKADPGKEMSWRLTYDFYTAPTEAR
jgi:hypothetical protein